MLCKGTASYSSAGVVRDSVVSNTVMTISEATFVRLCGRVILDTGTSKLSVYCRAGWKWKYSVPLSPRVGFRKDKFSILRSILAVIAHL